jgi:serine/threonine protein kinase
LLRELGRGSFGVVFQAVDPDLDRLVALKVAQPEAAAGAAYRGRFAREGKAAARLDHPNIVPVYEVGKDGGVAYIAMPYVEGVTLAHWLQGREEPVPFRHAAGLLLKVAEAVQHAHERGVLHRDLKPRNILVRPAPVRSADDPGVEPRVCDFGLAKLVEGGDDETVANAQIGSPPYMSPEQVYGALGPCGPASDVYALGVTLYELLAGRPPFRAETRAETLRQVVQDAPARPGRYRPGTPRDLEAICLKCLEKSPDRRYPSAAALTADLRRYLAGEPTRARPAAPGEAAIRRARRHPALAALAAALAVLAALATSLGWAPASPGRPAADARAAPPVAGAADPPERVAHDPGQTAGPAGDRPARSADAQVTQHSTEVRRLFQEGVSKREIARKVGISRNSVRHLLGEGNP